MENIREIVASNLREWMRANPDLNSQPKLSERSGVAQSHISRILNQQAAATIEMLQQLARAFRRRPGDLLEPPGHARAVQQPVTAYAVRSPTYRRLCELIESAHEEDLPTVLSVVKAVLESGRGRDKPLKRLKKRTG